MIDCDPRSHEGGIDVDREADVIVVGAGPAGSSTAYFLAQAGLRVFLLEKGTFPREKVCGDGLTPRAVRMLVSMGVDVSSEAGWRHARGLRIVAGGAQLELDWPELASFPSYGLVRSRADLDTVLARRAVHVGARLYEGVTAVGPVREERTDRVIGVTVRSSANTSEGRSDTVLRAPVVVAADGVSSRLSLAVGLRRRVDRPLGVAVRAYHTTPRHADDYLEAWFGIPDASAGGRLLPGYGWVFGMGDGTCNVGLGALNAPGASRRIDYRAVLASWLASMPPEWGISAESRTGPVLGAALPMGLNRTPLYIPGMLLVGDAGGMVNPFTGEGIAYALESGRLAAEVVVQALGRHGSRERERVLASYPSAVADAYGGYYALGRGFVRLINNPGVMRLASRHGLSHPALTRFVFAVMSNLTEPRGDPTGRVLDALTRMTRSR